MQEKIKAIIARERLVPVVKLDRAEDALPLADALMAGGINVAEITYRTSAGAPSLAAIAKNRPQMTVGAGTIINAAQCTDAISKGAQFIVSPGFSEEIAAVCEATDTLYVPGCVTPTEIMAAVACGLDVIKFFPAEVFGGIGAIKALSAPFPHIKFMPTGGVSQSNLSQYLASDKIVACGGSWMVKDSLINSGDFAAITALASEAKKEIAAL